jgi:hypothetical protein
MFLNKKAVEGLPLKYIIMALVAALVVGIALQMTGTLQGGIQGTAEKLNSSVTERVTCELDDEEPKIDENSITCNATSNVLSVNVDITDDCGLDRAVFIDADNDEWTDLTEGNNDEWSGTLSGTGINYDAGDLVVTILAYDKATPENEGKLVETVDCKV